MAYMINDECISCGACEPECKNGAISEGETVYVINAAKCTECVGWFDSPQCVDVCPVDAPVLDPNNKETKEQLIEKWKAQNPGKTPEAGV
jgi:ferredoxin